MTTSDYIALVASFTSIAALIATVWQLKLTRLHNIKSMRPVLDLTGNILRNSRIQYILTNHGVGPAFVTKVRYFVNDKCYSECNPEDISNIIHELGYSRPVLDFNCMTQLENCPLGVDKQVILIEFLGTESDDQYFDYMNNLLLNFTIEVEYKSVYEETYIVRLAKNQ
ncbi:hypothetical protein [Vibrio sp. R78045]|uniref:hypothetical protein n=1 Tax=Vibrio sp. R78045 TaxID=3093868 RepID=UPI0036F33AD3